MVFRNREPESMKYNSTEEYYKNESPKGIKLSKEKLNLEKQRLKIEDRRLKALSQSRSSRISELKKIQVAPNYSKQQNFLRGLFGHGDKVIFNSPDSECRTTLNGALINNAVNGYPIDEDSAADSFGFGYQKKTTGKFFGIR